MKKITRIKITVTTDEGTEEDLFDRDVTEVTECRSSFGVYEIKAMDLVNKFLSGEFEFLIQGKIKELENQPFDMIKEIKE